MGCISLSLSGTPWAGVHGSAVWLLLLQKHILGGSQAIHTAFPGVSIGRDSLARSLRSF